MRRLVCIAVALLGLAGCGVPTSGDPTTIPSSEIPYGLAEPEPTDPTDTTLQTDIAETAVYLLGPDEALVPRGRDLPPAPLVDRLEALLRELAAGPSAAELADELSSKLPPEVMLDVSQVEDGTATIDIGGPVDAPSGSDSQVAVAQVVLTATSIPQVHAVRLMREGELIDAPLPDGELTSEPLTADDYATYLIPPPPPTPTPTRTPAAPR